MDASGRQWWPGTVIVVGVVYLVVGIASAAFAGWSASNQMRVAWRLLAFLISAVAFAIHTGYEHLRFGNPAVVTALHASMAVAVGLLVLRSEQMFRGSGSSQATSARSPSRS